MIELTELERVSIGKIEKGLREYALADIKEVSKGNCLVASFILCSCFIDQNGSLRYGDCGSNKNEKTCFLVD